MEMTRVLRDTWHAALNHEWYDLLKGHEIVPICCHGDFPDVLLFDFVFLAGGNDMLDIQTWRNNHYPLRDTFERRLINECAIAGIPLIGICRGQHFLNHVSGGTHKLMQNPYDNVQVALEPFSVTCHHTIQIDQLAPGFETLLEDAHGTKELVINAQRRQLGVGWHPERAVNAHTRQYLLELINTL